MLTAPDISYFSSAGLLPKQVRGLATNCFNDPVWLDAFEQLSGIQMTACHHVLKQDGKPIGFMPGYIQKESLSGTLGERLFGRLYSLPFFNGLGSTKAFVCTSPWGYYSGIECGPDPTPEINETFIMHIEKIVKEHKLKLSGFPYVPESSQTLRKQLEELGYRSFPCCPTTYIELKGKSFDEYVSTIPSKRNRRTIRSERRKAAPLKIEWFDEENPAASFSGRPLFEILKDLHDQAWSKYNDTPSPLNEDFLKTLWLKDKENLRLCLASLDDRIIAFCLLRVLEDSAHALMMGKDYTCAEDYFAYFNVVYYEPICRGLDEGWKAIYLRPSVYQAKLRRGCELEPLHLYVKGHNLFTKTFLGLYIKLTWKYFHTKWVPPKLFSY